MLLCLIYGTAAACVWLYDCIQETGPLTDNQETEPTQSVQDADQQRSTGTTYTATYMLLQYHILSIEALATSK